MPVYGWVAFAILLTGLVLLLVGGNDGTLLGVEPAQVGALTAMMALLVYLGGGMFGRGQPVAPLVRHLLIWGAVLAVLLVGYWLFQDVLA
jgi:hypothetical protein